MDFYAIKAKAKGTDFDITGSQLYHFTDTAEKSLPCGFFHLTPSGYQSTKRVLVDLEIDTRIDVMEELGPGWIAITAECAEGLQKAWPSQNVKFYSPYADKHTAHLSLSKHMSDPFDIG